MWDELLKDVEIIRWGVVSIAASLWVIIMWKIHEIRKK
jgi:hypothetical protein